MHIFILRKVVYNFSSSDLQRSSVVATASGHGKVLIKHFTDNLIEANSSSLQFVFTKGSLESVVACCQPDTVPVVEINKLCTEYAKKGNRLLAFAWKSISDLTQSMERNQVEMDLIFIGIVVLKNCLKASIAGIVQQLLK